MNTKLALCVGALFVVSMKVGAPVSARWQEAPIAAEYWTDEAKLVLARAWVGEADWNAVDHVAIGWVLAKRWSLFNQTHEPAEQVRFETFIRAYSAALKSPGGKRTRRQELIQGLPWGDPTEGVYAKPANVAKWQKVRDRIEKWGRGWFRDPCRPAIHWGGTMDKPHRNWTPIWCGKTKNIFYRKKVALHQK